MGFSVDLYKSPKVPFLVHTHSLTLMGFFVVIHFPSMLFFMIDYASLYFDSLPGSRKRHSVRRLGFRQKLSQGHLQGCSGESVDADHVLQRHNNIRGSWSSFFSFAQRLNDLLIHALGFSVSKPLDRDRVKECATRSPRRFSKVSATSC